MSASLEPSKILVSPPQQTQQTAGALKMDFIFAKQIATEAADWSNYSGMILVVGPEPTLGETIR